MEPSTGQPQNPMALHVRIIAIIYLVFGALAAIGTLVVLVAFFSGAGLFASEDEGGIAGFLAALGLFLALLVAAFAVMYLMAGRMLLKHRRAGKTWGIVAAIPSLFSFPVGTALGIYAMVILTRPETEQLLATP